MGLHVEKSTAGTERVNVLISEYFPSFPMFISYCLWLYCLLIQALLAEGWLLASVSYSLFLSHSITVFLPSFVSVLCLISFLSSPLYFILYILGVYAYTLYIVITLLVSLSYVRCSSQTEFTYFFFLNSSSVSFSCSFWSQI